MNGKKTRVLLACALVFGVLITAAGVAYAAQPPDGNGNNPLQALWNAILDLRKTSVSWFGNAMPAQPRANDAYYDASTGSSYIYDGSGWTTFAAKGEPGPQGPKGDKGDPGTGTAGVLAYATYYAEEKAYDSTGTERVFAPIRWGNVSASQNASDYVARDGDTLMLAPGHVYLVYYQFEANVGEGGPVGEAPEVYLICGAQPAYEHSAHSQYVPGMPFHFLENESFFYPVSAQARAFNMSIWVSEQFVVSGNTYVSVVVLS